MVSLSNHEVVAGSRHASSFDKLRMRLLLGFSVNLFVNIFVDLVARRAHHEVY